MNIPTVAFTGSGDPITVGVPISQQKNVVKKKEKKQPVIKFSDSDSDEDNPIPLLKGSEDSEDSDFSDEEHIPTNPAAVRKRFKRPLPRSLQQKKNAEKAEPSSQKFRPMPPNAPKVPLERPAGHGDRPRPLRRNLSASGSDMVLPHPPIPNLSINKNERTKSFQNLDQSGIEEIQQQQMMQQQEIERIREQIMMVQQQQQQNQMSSISLSKSAEITTPILMATEYSGEVKNDDPPISATTSRIDSKPPPIPAVKQSVSSASVLLSPAKKAMKKLKSGSANNSPKNSPRGPPMARPPPSCYFMERKILSKIGKSKVSLTLTKGSTSILFHIFESKKESISIKSDDTKYSLLIADGSLSFGLRKSKYGDDIFNILYSPMTKPVKHKQCVLRFNEKIKNIPKRLQSKTPVLNADGEVIQSFGQRQVIPSVKNMQFLDKFSREVVAVMRISKTSICIEAAPQIPDIYVFVIGVSAFLNHGP